MMRGLEMSCREGHILMRVSAVMAGLLSTWQLVEVIHLLWSCLSRRTQTLML
jgi:hypothetical protein